MSKYIVIYAAYTQYSYTNTHSTEGKNNDANGSK